MNSHLITVKPLLIKVVLDHGFNLLFQKTSSTAAEMEHMCSVRGHMGYALFSPAGPVAL